MIKSLELLAQIEETAQQSADMPTWDSEPILKAVELLREQLQALLPGPGDYHVEVGLTGYASPLDAAWGAQSSFTGIYLPMVTVTASDGTRHNFDLAKQSPPEEGHNPGCDRCGMHDAVARVDLHPVCVGCLQPEDKLDHGRSSRELCAACMDEWCDGEDGYGMLCRAEALANKSPTP